MTGSLPGLVAFPADAAATKDGDHADSRVTVAAATAVTVRVRRKQGDEGRQERASFARFAASLPFFRP